jgi:CRP/FNR family transcriptional regulator, cyclic AMP receptor protein
MAIFTWRFLRRTFRDEKFREEVHFLKNVPIFHNMSTRHLGRIRQAIQTRFYNAGEVLFSEGQVGRAIFIIRSGQVELSKKTESGGGLKLGLLNPGQVFGEMALLENQPRTATATMVESGEICLLYTSTLEALIKSHPDVGVKLLRNIAVMLSTLLRRTNEKLEDKMKEAMK